MLSSFPLNNDGSSTMPIELQDILLDRHRSIADWIALMKVKQRSGSTPFSDHHLRLVARSSDPGPSWSDLDLTTATSDPGGRSGASGKAGKSERYKTELCRSFEETGFCKYKEKCQFAHGFPELRNVQRHPKYKTDLCRTYHSTGFCPYGSRCHFVHAELTPLTTTASTAASTSRPPLPPPGTSELQAERDFRKNVDGSVSSPDQVGGISLERLEQYLDTFNRVLRAFSHCPPPPQSPTSPSPNNSFDVLVRQDSVSSGSMRSTPDRLSTAPEKWNGYSGFSSCSSDSEVFGGYGGVLQSPHSPPASLFGPNGPEPPLSSSGLSNSNFWARTTTALHHHHHHPLSNLFSQTSI